MSTIPMQPCQSSQIEAIGHDPVTFSAFRGAESIGSHFYKHIKSSPDKYPYTRQPEPEGEQA